MQVLDVCDFVQYNIAFLGFYICIYSYTHVFVCKNDVFYLR